MKKLISIIFYFLFCLFSNLFADEINRNTDLTFYTGNFDITDEVGDDEATLF